MLLERVHILGIPFVHATRKQFVEQLQRHIQKEEKAFVVTANPEIVMKANDDPAYGGIVRKANYVTADGIGVVKAAQLLKSPLPERVAGYDLMVDLLQIANENKYSVYLLGASEDTLRKTVENIHSTYPNVQIVGSHNGFFDWNNPKIQQEIDALKPDLTFVALGVPRQEKWISENIETFEKGIFIGVGGSFDVIAGTVKRAPVAWQKANLEWLYRIMKQPSRLGRALALPKFVIKVLQQKVKGAS